MNIGFDIAIQAEPDFSAAKLNPGAKADRALHGIAHVAAIDLVVGQLLQSVPVKDNPHVLS